MTTEQLDGWDDEALEDYEIGFQARVDDEPFNPEASEGWRKGWRAADQDS